MRKLPIFFLLIAFSSFAAGQDLPSNVELEKLLDRAEEQSQKYTQTFRNLSAQETKTKFYYETNGELDEKRVIKSLFIIYESPDNRRSQEYRKILEYNGKNVRRDEKATEKFFANLGKTDSGKKEFDKLFKEGTRYDGRVVTWGTTLYQERPFNKNRRPFFDFKVIGKETIEGREVFVIEYKQTKQTNLIIANPTDFERKNRAGGAIEYSTVIPDDFQPTYPLINGKIWLDKETAQIWRNEFQVVLHPSNLSKPLISIESFFEYQTSDFGILVPKKFLIRSFRIKGKNDKTLSVTKDAESVFEYTKFREYKTDAKISGIN